MSSRELTEWMIVFRLRAEEARRAEQQARLQSQAKGRR